MWKSRLLSNSYGKWCRHVSFMAPDKEWCSSIRRISEIFAAGTVLSYRVFPVSSDFFDSLDLKISIFFFWEQIFTSGIIHNKTSKTRNVKIYSLHAEGSHINKNNGGTLCESTILFCGWVLVICRAGNRPEIKVTVSF